MSNKNSSKLNSNVMNAVLYIVVGLLFCIFRLKLLKWAMTAIGIALIVVGILSIVKNKLTEGIIMIAVGVLVILGGWLFVEIIALILGVILIAKGVLDIVKIVKEKYPLIELISPILTAIVGVMLIANTWGTIDWVFIILGIILIVDGVLLLFAKEEK